MKTVIYNTELLKAMKNGIAWQEYCNYAESYGHNQYPIGGVDHIEIKPNSITIHDIGVNGKFRDIVIRRDK